MKSLLYIITPLIILSSCDFSRISVAYTNKFYYPDSTYISSTTLNDTTLWYFPVQIECADSVLIVLDEMNGYFLHLYDLTGREIGHIARKGQGPGEVLHIDRFHCSNDKKKIYAYDSGSRKLVEYELATACSAKPTFREYTIDFNRLPESDVPTIIYALLPTTDMSRFIVKGNRDGFRYGVYDCRDGSLTTCSTEFPDGCVQGNEQEARSVLTSDTRTLLRPDGTKILNATYIGGIMELFRVESSPIAVHADTMLCIYPPVYGLAEGAVPAFAVGNEQTQPGFEDVAVTNTDIYALLHRPGELEEPRSILVFNWEGRAIRRYDTDCRLSRICLDSSGQRVFALALNEENGYALIALDLL